MAIQVFIWTSEAKEQTRRYTLDTVDETIWPSHVPQINHESTQIVSNLAEMLWGDSVKSVWIYEPNSLASQSRSFKEKTAASNIQGSTPAREQRA